jgi:hypothetical protein
MMLFANTPVSPSVTPLPLPLEVVIEARLPSASATLTWVVPRLERGRRPGATPTPSSDRQGRRAAVGRWRGDALGRVAGLGTGRHRRPVRVLLGHDVEGVGQLDESGAAPGGSGGSLALEQRQRPGDEPASERGGRVGEQPRAPVLDRQGLALDDLVAGEVLGREQAAVGRLGGDDGGGDVGRPNR